MNSTINDIAKPIFKPETVPGKSEKQPIFYGKRIEVFRNIVYISGLIVTILVPQFKLLKIDLLHGEFFFFMKQLNPDEAKKIFVIAFSIVNVMVFVFNYLFGRLICGWFCPVGFFARLSQKLQNALLKKKRKLGKTQFHLYALLGSLAVAPIFVDWAFLDASNLFRPHDPFFLYTVAGTVGIGLLIYAFVGRSDFWFCRALCPSGAYFTLLSRTVAFDLTFEDPDACINCDACIRICPTDLDPRHREVAPKKLKSNWDIYPNDYKHSSNRCFLCGDCITACDAIFEKLSTRKKNPVDRKYGLLRFGPAPKSLHIESKS